MTIRALAALFYRELDRFEAAWGRPTEARLEIRQRPASAGPRDYAYELGGKVVIYREAARLPLANVIGLIRHELGHVCDPIDDDEGAEGRADQIAEAVTGERIRYDRDGIQTIGCGGRRPARLRRT